MLRGQGLAKFHVDRKLVAGDKAIVTMSLHLDRLARRPDNSHHVQTCATERWIRVGSQWLLGRFAVIIPDDLEGGGILGFSTLANEITAIVLRAC